MTIDVGLIDWVSEVLEPVGPVTMRKMMGGATLYCDGTIFAIVADDLLWFKADAASDAVWDTAGSSRFTFTMKGEQVTSMNYRAAPDDVYDDADAMQRWAGLALEAGRRAPVRKRKPKKQP